MPKKKKAPSRPAPRRGVQRGRKRKQETESEEEESEEEEEEEEAVESDDSEVSSMFPKFLKLKS